MACCNFGLAVELKDLMEYLIKETFVLCLAVRNQFTVNKMNFRTHFALRARHLFKNSIVKFTAPIHKL